MKKMLLFVISFILLTIELTLITGCDIGSKNDNNVVLAFLIASLNQVKPAVWSAQWHDQ